MKARGIVFEKKFGACGERLPHPLRVRLIDGPNADPDGAGFCLLGTAPVGATVTVEYAPDDQFARLVISVPAGARTARAATGSAPKRASHETELDSWSSEDIEGSCPVCEAWSSRCEAGVSRRRTRRRSTASPEAERRSEASSSPRG